MLIVQIVYLDVTLSIWRYMLDRFSTEFNSKVNISTEQRGCPLLQIKNQINIELNKKWQWPPSTCAQIKSKICYEQQKIAIYHWNLNNCYNNNKTKTIQKSLRKTQVSFFYCKCKYSKFEILRSHKFWLKIRLNPMYFNSRPTLVHLLSFNFKFKVIHLIESKEREKDKEGTKL